MGGCAHWGWRGGLGSLRYTGGLVWIAATSAPALASVVYVNAAASGANDGGSWTNAFNKLQNGLAVAGTGDELWVASAT